MKTILLINRRPHPGQFSIENIFNAIGQQLRNRGLDVIQYVSPRHSKGVFSRLYNAIHVSRLQGDVCHIVGDVTYLALFIERQRLIVTIHDLNVYERKSGFPRILVGLLWYRIPIARARFVTAISEFTRQAIVDQFGVSPNRVRVIPNPVPGLFRFEEKRPVDTSGVIDILQVGTKENKNLSRVVQALCSLSEKYFIRLNIVGRLARDVLPESTPSLEIVNCWDLPLEDIVFLYRKSHIVLFASLYEGFGMPIIEAQAIGRPVVTSNIEPLVTVSGGAALFVDPFSTEDIAKGVETVIQNPRKADELVERGLENARRYSVEAVAEQYATLYDEVR